MNTPHLTRRDFVTKTVLATALTAVAPSFARAETAAPRFKIIAFSKPFAQLSPDETADLVAEVGWDGIECPVRVKAGQIAPERVEEDLPKMVEALKKRGKEVTIVTTEITKLDPLAEKVLRTAAKLGIKKYRFGFVKYTADKPIPETVREVGAALKDLAAFNHELGLQGGWQNHSGADMVGAPRARPSPRTRLSGDPFTIAADHFPWGFRIPTLSGSLPRRLAEHRQTTSGAEEPVTTFYQ